MTPPPSAAFFHSENRCANWPFETNTMCRDFCYSGKSGSDSDIAKLTRLTH